LKGILDLSNKEALTALEKLTHTTRRNPHPVMPLSELVEDMPAMFRRAAIHAALGSARSFFTHRKKWQAKKEKATASGKKFQERPPVPPRTWNKSATLYAGMWKERTSNSLVLKIWTGTCWSWLKCRLTGRELPSATKAGSPSLVRRGKQWWLHTPVERQFTSPPKIEKQVATTPQTRICAVDLNLDGHIAVCTVQTAEGTILATRFLEGGREIAGLRKKLLGRMARHRSQTGLLAPGEQDNKDLWDKIRQRAFPISGRMFQYAKYKAWNEGIITSRVNPRNTSRECARCHALVIRYAAGQPMEGYTTGAPLVLCPECGMKGHVDRNASLVIGQRLLTRYHDLQEEKPPTPLLAEREPKG
jgi:transposase